MLSRLLGLPLVVFLYIANGSKTRAPFLGIVAFWLAVTHSSAVHGIDVAGTRSRSTYVQVFGGDGEPADGWPSMEQWVPTFEKMFESNLAIMRAGCAQFGVRENSDEEISHIKSSIRTVASDVDARFILAVVLQESNGCVRVGSTAGDVRNPGLMQSHEGTGSCSDNQQSTCPESKILQMIQDGTEGTAAGDGLKQCLAKHGRSGAAAHYKAARCYNSGSVALSGNLGQGGSTHCYVSDVANRLLGWSSGPSSCNEGTVGSLDSPESSGSSLDTTSSGFSSISVPACTSASLALSGSHSGQSFPDTVSFNPASVPLTSFRSFPSASASSVPAPLYPQVVSACRKFVTVQPGENCDILEARYAISAPDFRWWNAGLDEKCTNLWSGYQYCVGA